MKPLLGEKKNFEPVSTTSILSLAARPLLGQDCFLLSPQGKKIRGCGYVTVWVEVLFWNFWCTLVVCTVTSLHHLRQKEDPKATVCSWMKVSNSDDISRWALCALDQVVYNYIPVGTHFSAPRLRYFAPTVLFCIVQRCWRPTAPFQVLRQSN